MPIGSETVVLLGAGASQEAGVPTTFDMTRSLVEGASSRHQVQNSTMQALHFVCGALLAHDAAIHGQSPYAGLDVERVFAAVELLAERNTLEVTPFVASWHPAVDAWDTRDRSVPAFFNDQLKKAILDSPSFGGAQRLITDLIDSRTGGAADGKTYRDLAFVMLRELKMLVATTPKDVGYLVPLAIAGSQEKGLTIATLNYDLSIEQTAEAKVVPYTTGVEEWLNTGRWNWPDQGIRLLKLHGSINWIWAQAEEEPGQLPRRLIYVSNAPDEGRGQPAVVFGQRGKLRAEGPFLGLLGELETLMSRAEQLLVIGYSFRDEHVNELIQRWLSEDIARRITVVDPQWPERFHFGMPQDFRATLHWHLIPREQQPEDFRPRLVIRRERCSEALSSLF